MTIIQPKCWAKLKKINKAKYQSKIQIFKSNKDNKRLLASI